MKRIVRISFTDAEATDSSSSEDEQTKTESPSRRRGKRFIKEIVIDPSNSAGNLEVGKTRFKIRIPSRLLGKNKKKFRGVRQRPWGKWATEIRCGKAHGGIRKGGPVRLWLGTKMILPMLVPPQLLLVKITDSLSLSLVLFVK